LAILFLKVYLIDQNNIQDLAKNLDHSTPSDDGAKPPLLHRKHAFWKIDSIQRHRCNSYYIAP
jgi:hypothetical protein